MTLIAMAVHDTVENNRAALTERTLKSLWETVDFFTHRLFIIDNGSCEASKQHISNFSRLWMSGRRPDEHLSIITLPENIGTAKAVNLGWVYRRHGEHAIKMDNDVVIHQKNWVEELELAVELEPRIGIIGLKRKDCWETPWHQAPHLRSQLVMLPHQSGQRWCVVELVQHVMGTCQLYNAALLEKIGFLYQPRLYGFDDSLASARCKFAGFYNAFLPHVAIDHIDPGGDAYTDWKHKHSSEDLDRFRQVFEEYKTGARPIYCPHDYRD